MSGNIKINIDLASRVVTQNQYQKSWCCISVLIQYQKSSKWCVKTQYQNQEMDFVFSRSKPISRLALKCQYQYQNQDYCQYSWIFQNSWHFSSTMTSLLLKNTHFLLGIKRPNILMLVIQYQYSISRLYNCCFNIKFKINISNDVWQYQASRLNIETWPIKIGSQYQKLNVGFSIFNFKLKII